MHSPTTREYFVLETAPNVYWAGGYDADHSPADSKTDIHNAAIK